MNKIKFKFDLVFFLSQVIIVVNVE